MSVSLFQKNVEVHFDKSKNRVHDVSFLLQFADKNTTSTISHSVYIIKYSCFVCPRMRRKHLTFSQNRQAEKVSHDDGTCVYVGVWADRGRLWIHRVWIREATEQRWPVFRYSLHTGQTDVCDDDVWSFFVIYDTS